MSQPSDDIELINGIYISKIPNSKYFLVAEQLSWKNKIQ